jgi:hypothetical protein
MGEVVRFGATLVLIAWLGVAIRCGSSKDMVAGTAGDLQTGQPKSRAGEFIVPGGDNAVPEYGREATAAERRQASAVIQMWMRARAAKDFVEECRYFSRSFLNSFVAGDAAVVSEGRVKTCPQALAYFGSNASGDFRNTLTGSIDSLRVPTGRSAPSSAPGQGFAQYHGKGDTDYEVPMHRERGAWWVAAAAPLSQEG